MGSHHAKAPHAPAALSAAQYTLERQIGTGSFGTVFLAVHRATGQQCAIKRIDLESSDDDIEEIQKEIAILAECNDAHITRYYGCFMHEFELWIVMEYLGAGSCLDLVKTLRPATLPEGAIAEILAQVVTGLAYLHGSGKIHRDIKAANVLIAASGDVKIADFGVAAQLSNNLSRRNTFVGTPFWMAPEVINQLDYHFSADIWSLGITAFELAYGKPPWSHLHPMKALFSIPRSDAPRLDAKHSRDFQDFVARCLQKDPRERATVAELVRHPFLARRSRPELLRMLHECEQRQAPLEAEAAAGLPASTSSSTLAAGVHDGSRTIDTSTYESAAQAAARRRRSADSQHSADSQRTVYSEQSHQSSGGSRASGAHGAAGSPNERTAPPASRSSTSANSGSSSTVGAALGSLKLDSDDDISSNHNSGNSAHPKSGVDADDDDAWDFDTLKPQPSLEEILQHPPAGGEVPPPIPASPAPSGESGFNTVASLRGNGAGTLVPQGSQSIVRIFSHAARKFHDPVLGEISDLLRADPLTVGVENYLLRRLGKHAMQHLGVRMRERQPPLDNVEQILLDKWLEEVRELHGAEHGA